MGALASFLTYTQLKTERRYLWISRVPSLGRLVFHGNLFYKLSLVSPDSHLSIQGKARFFLNAENHSAFTLISSLIVSVRKIYLVD